MNKFKIAILGSCPTRDPFNSKFKTNYKDFYEVVATQFQTSIISLMSEPIEYAIEKLDGVHPSKVNEIEKDLNKSFLNELKETQPDYLIIDNWADHYHGVLRLNDGRYITNNKWRIVLTTFLKEQSNTKKIELSKDTNEYLDIFNDSITRFLDFVKKELPHTKIILHKARNVKTFLDENNIVQDFSTALNIKIIDIDLFNHFWEQLDKCIDDKCYPQIIDIFNESYFSSEKHAWGKLQVHYNYAYYFNFISALHNIVMSDTQKKCINLTTENTVLKEKNILLNSHIKELKMKHSKKLKTLENQPIISIIKKRLSTLIHKFPLI